jgi:hypothetical protein
MVIPGDFISHIEKRSNPLIRSFEKSGYNRGIRRIFGGIPRTEEDGS